MNSLFVRYLRCLSQYYMADFLESCEAYKHLPAKEADGAKLQYSAFLSDTTKVNKNDFVKFSKVTDRIDTFLFKYIGENNRYIYMFKVFKMLVILSHGQAQGEHGFSFNSKILVENLQKESLVAQGPVTDHMHYNNIQVHELTMTKKLFDKFKEACSRYLTSLKEIF